MPNKLIARRLEISEKTVKSHLTSIFRQIGVTDRVQAILWVERQGLRGDLRAVASWDQGPVAAGADPPQTVCVTRFLVSTRDPASRCSPPGPSPPSRRTAAGEVRVAGVCGKGATSKLRLRSPRRRHRASVRGRPQPRRRRLACLARARAPRRLEGRRQDDPRRAARSRCGGRCRICPAPTPSPRAPSAREAWSVARRRFCRIQASKAVR